MTPLFRFHTALSAILGSFLLLTTLALAQRVEPTSENISKGEAIYKKHCQMCHGETGPGRWPSRKTDESEAVQFSRQRKDGRRDRRGPSETNHEGKEPRCRRLNES